MTVREWYHLIILHKENCDVRCPTWAIISKQYSQSFFSGIINHIRIYVTNVCTNYISWIPASQLFFPQVHKHFPEPLLARVLVPSSLIIWSAIAGKHGLLTVLTMGLVYITVLTVRMQDFAAQSHHVRNYKPSLDSQMTEIQFLIASSHVHWNLYGCECEWFLDIDHEALYVCFHCSTLHQWWH